MTIAFPRVCELRSLIGDPNNPNAYFRNFDASVIEEPLRMSAWERREQELQRLDLDAWTFLKAEAQPHLTLKNMGGRGWQQLIDILNQARAHNYLTSIGCTGVRFIPRTKTKTPDLEAQLDGLKMLCEVKTLNISEEEVSARQKGEGTVSNRLSPAFFGKLASTLREANSQMEAYDSTGRCKRLTYLIVIFDDLNGDYKEEYYRQIDNYLCANLISEMEIVFHNEKTSIHKEISMASAIVVNE